MEPVWWYVAVTVLGAFAAVCVRQAVRGDAARRHGEAWVSVALGVWFVLLYEMDVDRDVFLLVVGVACILLGAHRAEVGRLRDRIRSLEDEVRGHRQPVS
jgi:hypothetical protein